MNYNNDIYKQCQDKITTFLIENFFPGGTWDKDEYWCLNPLRNDNDPKSFSIHETGLYNDFASGDKGNFVGLVSKVHNLTKREAAQLVIEKAGGIFQPGNDAIIKDFTSKGKRANKPAYPPMYPQPIDGLEKIINRINNNAWYSEKWGQLVKVYTYNDIQGNPVYYIARFNQEENKNHIPFYFYSLNGIEHLENKQPLTNNRPLYNLHLLNAADNILIVEGEKCGDVLVDGFTLMSWPGGANGIKKADWTPLKDKANIIIWPDNDEPGRKAAAAIQAILPQAKILDIQKTEFQSISGWDIADAESNGLNLPEFIKECPLVDSADEEYNFFIQSEIPKTEKIKTILSGLYNFRFNEITGRTEFSPVNKNDYTDFTDRHFNSLRSHLLTHHFKKLPKDELEMIIESDYTTSYNPITDYFNGLPKWDGQTDYIKQLSYLVTATPGQYGDDIDSQYVFYSYLKRWLIGCTAQMLQRHEHHQCLTILGHQGIGKTTFLRSIGISDNLVYVGAINPADKDSKILYTEKSLIVLDELEASTKFELASIKSNMTLDSITIRRPYARRPEVLPRRASFCASANGINVLADLTGSRRWLCIEVDSIQYKSVTPELMRSVYSQALHLLNQGEKYWFDKDEIPQIEKRNERFNISTPEEEMIIKHYSPAPFREAKDFKTNTEILAELSDMYPGIKFSSKIMGGVLAKLKFERGKKGGVYKYALKAKG